MQQFNAQRHNQYIASPIVIITRKLGQSLLPNCVRTILHLTVLSPTFSESLSLVSFRFYFRAGQVNRTILLLMERPRSLRLASNPINKIH